MLCEGDGDCKEDEQCLYGVCLPAPEDYDRDAFAAGIDCDDMDRAFGFRAERLCYGPCGSGIESCVNGQWGECSARQEDDCECIPGSVRETEALRCGKQLQVCGEAGVWQNEGRVQGEGECSPGELDGGVTACARCGTLRRICLDNCLWDASRCEGGGDCEAGAVERQPRNCGACALEQERTRTCSSGCAWGDWGEWSDCMEVAGCTPGASWHENDGCERCGIRTRVSTCDETCTWGAFGSWGACENQRSCEAFEADSEQGSCGSCNEGVQQRTRTCSSTCEWSEFGAWSSCGSSGCVPMAIDSDPSNACLSCGSSGVPGTSTVTLACSISCEWEVTGEGLCSSHECDVGDDRTQSCGMGGCELFGYRAAACETNCTWGPWSGLCSYGAECAEGDTRACDCPCGLGLGTETCDSACAWGPCACDGGDGCTPGAAMLNTTSCGACDEGTQTFVSTCGCVDGVPRWGASVPTGGCTGEGCNPADTQTGSAGCPECQEAIRTCAGDCTWGGWGACADTETCGGGCVECPPFPVSCDAGHHWDACTCECEIDDPP